MEEFRWVASIKLYEGEVYFIGPFGRLVADKQSAVCHEEAAHLYNQIKQWQPELHFCMVPITVNIKEH